jgi:hypothetical protein
MSTHTGPIQISPRFRLSRVLTLPAVMTILVELFSS